MDEMATLRQTLESRLGTDFLLDAIETWFGVEDIVECYKGIAREHLNEDMEG